MPLCSVATRKDSARRIPFGLMLVSMLMAFVGGWQNAAADDPAPPAPTETPAEAPTVTPAEAPAEAGTDEAPPTGTKSDEVLAGHSAHGEAFNEGPRQAAYLMGGTGEIEFPVSSQVSEVQGFVEQGIGQLHGFWYFEAERSFRQAAQLDPDCAIAYWGMAMANANNSKRAKEFIKEAMERKASAAPHEQMFIEAYHHYLNDSGNKNDKTKKYVEALEQIVHKFPEQLEYKAQLGYALYKYRSTLKKEYDEVNEFLNEILAEQPYHPVHHYRIHLWDYKKPENALNSAARCGQSAPAIAHMWHMPGHIYSRLKRYHDAVWQQEASARVDHAQMIRNQILPDQIHNFAHNNEWLIRNLVYIGRHQDATDLARNMVDLPRHPKYNTLSRRGSSYYGRLRLFEVLARYERWDDLLVLANTPYLEPTDKEDEQLKRLRHLGIAQAHAGSAEAALQTAAQIEERLVKAREKADAERAKEAAEDAKKQAAEARQHLASVTYPRAANLAAEQPPAPELPPAPEPSDPKAEKKAEAERKKQEAARKATEKRRQQEVSKVEKHLAAVRGHIAWAQGNLEEALKQLQASDEEKIQQARVLAVLGKAEEAVKLAREYATAGPEQTEPLAGLIEVLWTVGQRDEAAKSFEELRKISSAIQFGSPVFDRLHPIAAELGLPEDWRVEREVPEDFGCRPPLDQLGPFRWSPFEAKPFTLPDQEGAEYSLVSLQGRENGQTGRPIVVIFYLGYGCLHCAEQLHAFAPRTADFQEAGIDMVAISTDDQSGLKKSIENYTGGPMPFPLLADPTFDVFKAYRAYDDFESMPLHGTFLIDGDGKVRWQDISYEPFMDVDFVLAEAQRLLAQSATPPSLAKTQVDEQTAEVQP